jgi:hypothetical protein
MQQETQVNQKQVNVSKISVSVNLRRIMAKIRGLINYTDFNVRSNCNNQFYIIAYANGGPAI